MQGHPSLHTENPKMGYIAFLLAASLILLILGLFLPAIHLRELVVFQSTFSVITGIINLFHEGHIVLGIVIVLFSVIFPIGKLIALSLIWFQNVSAEKKALYIKWLEILGKWSMLDVFCVAVTVVITQISHLAKAEARIGIYFFGASIILTMITTARIGKIIALADQNNKKASPSE